MGLLDSIKGYFNTFEDEDIEEMAEEIAEKQEVKKVIRQEEPKRVEPRIISSKNKTVSYTTTQMQVVLVKPERFEDVRPIADHINDKKTVVLNLEAADKENSRRIVDFLTGATYANHGIMKKVSRATFVITPEGVDMMGEVLMEEFEEGRLYL